MGNKYRIKYNLREKGILAFSLRLWAIGAKKHWAPGTSALIWGGSFPANSQLVDPFRSEETYSTVCTGRYLP